MPVAKHSNAYVNARQEWVQWMRSTLIGPFGDCEDEELTKNPLEIYSTGILACDDTALQEGMNQSPAALDNGDESKRDSSAESGENSAYHHPRNVSSIGMSFLATADIELEVFISAGEYDHVDGVWERKKVEDSVQLERPTAGNRRYSACKGKCQVYYRCRPYAGAWLITVALINKKPLEGTGRFRQKLAASSLFQASFVCTMQKGGIKPYPRAEEILLTDEEQELELQYRHRQTFGIGHGVAVDWRTDSKGALTELRAEFLPCVEVPLVTTNNADIDINVLDLDFLSGVDQDPSPVVDAIEAFIDVYGKWVDVQTAKPYPSDLEDAALRISGRQREAIERLRQGCLLLKEDKKVRKAFALAHRAMRDQMHHVRLAQGESQELPEKYFWRPFQLGFVLLALESVVDEEAPSRDIVDLLWFPTGGGKTEAYLALIAVEIIYRRLRYRGSGGGTAVIMRYTMRLLTAQQFQRANTLICALEKMRRENPRELGSEPITSGLWIGAKSTPNTHREACKLFKELREGEAPGTGFFLDVCPWCGTPLMDKDQLGIVQDGDRIRFCCPSSQCVFHDQLPFHSVDESLYENPPTLLLATIDKFAQFAIREKCGVFLGCSGNRPPGLIVQDELHLIAEELGSFTGIYEAGIDTVLKMRDSRPKYIASTATIRNANEQSRLIYGRAMAIFPPPGHSSDDSFFSQVDHNRPGRLYVGFHGTAHRKNHLQNLAELVGGALVLPLAKDWTDQIRDAWWTVVVYLKSLRAVGETQRIAHHEVKQVCERIKKQVKEKRKRDGDEQIELEERIVDDSVIEEITSRVDADGIQDVLQRLKKRHDESNHIALAMCTSMLSVGIDVPRLAFMILQGQTLSTAEYIQASSRVGRADVPGIVVVNLSQNPRDVSHYENFRPFHESFYRFVEPTSVTPFSETVRLRAMHAAVVIALRYSIDELRANEAAKLMNPENSAVKKVIDILLARIRQADPSAWEAARDQVHRLLAAWSKETEKPLRYLDSDNVYAGLLRKPFEEPKKGLWEVMMSLRSVDRQSRLSIRLKDIDRQEDENGTDET